MADLQERHAGARPAGCRLERPSRRRREALSCIKLARPAAPGAPDSPARLIAIVRIAPSPMRHRASAPPLSPRAAPHRSTGQPASVAARSRARASASSRSVEFGARLPPRAEGAARGRDWVNVSGALGSGISARRFRIGEGGEFGEFAPTAFAHRIGKLVVIIREIQKRGLARDSLRP